MIAMIFEYWFDPDAPEAYAEYLDTADEIRTYLPAIDGYLGVERFKSCTDESKYLALGFFEDEEAVARWRNHPEHRRVQALGRQRFFTDYRLRMAEVVRDYGPSERSQAPRDSRKAHDQTSREAS